MDLARLKDNWETLAQRDPMWAILSDPAMKGGKWDPAAFFESGRTGIDNILRHIEAAKFPLHRGTALDFGCGIGRLTQALAGHFEKTYGVDISPTMIAQAESYNRFGDSCKYVVNDSPDLHRFADDMFDFVYSDAVLQHIPPEASKAYIEEFVRVLKPGGLLAFQVPSVLRAATAEPARGTTIADAPRQAFESISIASRIRNFFSRPKREDLGRLIEAHGVPCEEVCRLLETRSARLLQAQEENWWPEWVSFRYWVTK